MRHSILILLILMPALPLQAKESFGRLFTTQEQRVQLDQLREEAELGQYVPVAEEKEETETSSDYYFNGYIKQNGKTKEVWVQKKGKNLKALDFRPSGTSAIDFSFSERNVKLKPGQVFSPSENKVDEQYKHKQND